MQNQPKLTTIAQRRLLYVASGLVLIMGVILFFLSNDTETFFSWTIGILMTAAFLGSGYLASFVLEFLAARESLWVRSRIAVPAVLSFTSLTFIVTMIHLDKFHLDSDNPITITITWAWILVYALVPIIMSIIYSQQLRSEGNPSPVIAPLPVWFKGILIALGGSMLLLGIGFLFIPTDLMSLWAWDQTALTARAIGAWLVGIGMTAVHCVLEDDWTRIQSVMIAYILFGGLQLINLLRYPNANGLDWSALNTWIYIGFVIVILLAGLYGTWQSKKHLSAQNQ